MKKINRTWRVNGGGEWKGRSINVKAIIGSNQVNIPPSGGPLALTTNYKQHLLLLS
jgi:hypothetical protein